ncbi:MAG TPA: hypothetical protein VF331_15040 [Polyangiales bacterium]
MTLAAVGCGSSKSGGGGSVQLSVSGEVLALGGYAFPPTSDGDPAFVDGWEVKFDELLVTLDHVTLSENPDKSATDQSQTDGAVARVDGPWAADLHQGGPLPGKGGSGEQALPIATIDNQNLNGGADFDDTKRYAFGFDIVAATDKAKQLNLDATARKDYAQMVKNGWAVLYVGTATWKGGSGCSSSAKGYDFGKLPQVVKFRLGFKSPTAYVNCQNPDNDPAHALGSEEHQRGIQIKANTLTIAQATVHTDHPFWQSFEHDTPAHFDQLAALAKNVGGEWTVTLDDLKGTDYTAFKDAAGKDLPWRSCLPSFTPPDQAPAMHFDSLGIPYDPSGKPSEVMRDYLDFMTYDQSTQGHLNSDGLCFVKRNYASPP